MILFSFAFFHQATKELSYKLDLDLVIDLTVIAHKSNLGTPFALGCKYLLKKLGTFSKYGLDRPYSCIMFTEEHLKKILPVLKHTPIPNDNFLCNVRYILSDGKSENDGDVFEQPGAEKRYISHSSNQLHARLLQRCIHSVELYGTGINADGLFVRDEDDSFSYHGGARIAEWYDGRGRGTHNYRFVIKYTSRGEESGWAIMRYRFLSNQGEDNPPVRKICWWSPYSKHLDVPPMKGWVPHDPLARGNPWLKYNLNETIE